MQAERYSVPNRKKKKNDREGYNNARGILAA